MDGKLMGADRHAKWGRLTIRQSMTGGERMPSKLDYVTYFDECRSLAHGATSIIYKANDGYSVNRKFLEAWSFARQRAAKYVAEGLVEYVLIYMKAWDAPQSKEGRLMAVIAKDSWAWDRLKAAIGLPDLKP